MKGKLTHSRMVSFKTCRKRHFWEYEKGFRKEVDAKALRIGSAGHEALDRFKQGLLLPDALSAVRVAYAHRPEGVEEYDWDVERETVECLVVGYSWRWGKSQIRTAASERSFALPILNPATRAATPLFEFAGKIDGLVELEDGRKAVLEHKFVSDAIDADSDFWRYYQLDTQVTGYVLAARQLGFEVESVLVDAIRKPTIRPEQIPILDEDGKKIVLDEAGNRVFNAPKTKAEKEAGRGAPRQTGDKKAGFMLQTRLQTSIEWGEKLLADIGARPEWYYARHEIARLDDDIRSLTQELWDIQRTLREAQLAKRWYKSASQHTCPFCPYFGLCSSQFDPAEDVPPDGFVALSDVHPEL